MLTARRTEAAERDLQDIAFYIASSDQRPEAADRIIDELVAQADSLAQSSKSSQMGTSCPELGDRVRLFSHKRWVFVFRYEAHGIDVLRIADSSQNYLAWRI